MARSEFAASFDATASELVAALFTHEVVFKTVDKTRGNPWESETAETVTASAPIKAGVLGPGTYRWNGQLVESDRRVVYVDSQSVTQVIDVASVIEIDGEDHAIETVTGYPEGANASAYEILVMIGG